MIKKKRLVIIPARGGSKRIKNKNIKKLLGTPLIGYSIQAVLKSKLFDKIHISSDNKKILSFANKLGVKTDFIRPTRLSNDNTSLAPVLKYVVDEYFKMGIKYDEVWLIYATNPFVNETIIKRCSKKFIKEKSKKPLITVSEYNYPPEWAQYTNLQNILVPINKKKLKTRSQDLRKSFCDAGMINIYPSSVFYKNLKNMKYTPFVLPAWESIDIDYLSDFKLAEQLMSVQK